MSSDETATPDKPKKKTHKPGNKGQRGGCQPGAGKPKKVIPPEDYARAMELAFRGCNNNSIELMMDWTIGFIRNRKDILRAISQKRAERRAWLLEVQNGMAEKVPAMAIFLGKNILDQADKKELKQSVGGTLAEIVAGLAKKGKS